MRLPRPNSMNSLVLTGFALVTLPLLFAIVWALWQIDGFARASESLLARGTVVAAQSRQLEEKITDMERNARQYQILEDAQILDYIQSDSNEITVLVDSLKVTLNDPAIDTLAEAVRRDTRRLAEVLINDAPSSGTIDATIAAFADLSLAATELSATINRFLETESRELRDDAARAQRTLKWQSLAIVPVTLGVVLIFTLLIGKPIRALDRAINQLGEGAFSKPIDVRGPSDLTALGKQLEWLRVRLLELAQEKNRFLRHMSHELKTPLANIREGTDLLLDGTVGNLDGPAHEVTTILRNNGLKLQRLIENLLSFSAWQTKSETLALQDFEFMAVVRLVVADHRLQLKSQQIRLHADIEKTTINADKEMLRTALDNLMSNALKFTPLRGSIFIRAQSAKDTFVIEVADTGPGIPRDEQARVFDPFFQGATEQSGPVAGTGIGLSVVAECARAHGGTIELVNGEFPGAHFRIHIPQEKAAVKEQLVAAG
ncbi:MAG: HAMP domain-containing sensor histidine kinase [Pseudomonadota bacterium]